MSIFDLLLETNTKKLNKKVKKDVEISRLSELLGEKFIVTCHPLTFEQMKVISEGSDEDTQVLTILEACKIEGKSFKDKKIIEKFNHDAPKEIIKKLFLVGEVFRLYKEVDELSGFGKNSVQEIKN